MRVYRGPKSADEIELTDDLSLKKANKNIRPNDTIFFDINLDKDAYRQSSAAIELALDDFELIHDNYIKHLKETIQDLSMEVSKHRAGWEAVSTYMHNLSYLDQKKKDIINYMTDLSDRLEHNQFSKTQYEDVSIDSIQYLEMEDALDICGKVSPRKALIHIRELVLHAPNDFDSLAESLCGKDYFYVDNNDELVSLIEKPDILNKIGLSGEIKAIKPSKLLDKLLKFMMKEEIIIKL